MSADRNDNDPGCKWRVWVLMFAGSYTSRSISVFEGKLDRSPTRTVNAHDGKCTQIEQADLNHRLIPVNVFVG